MHHESCSFARFALNLDPAAMLGYDIIGKCQAKAGAFADPLGVEKRLKHVRHIFGGNADAVVADFNPYPVVLALRANRDDARFLDRVRRIGDYHIVQNLSYPIPW